MVKNLLSKFYDLPVSVKMNLGLLAINLSILCLIIIGWLTSLQDFFSVTGTMGDTMGPIVGLVAAWLVFKTFEDQRKANQFNIDTYYATIIWDNLNKAEHKINNISFKGHKGKDTIIPFMKEIYIYTESTDGKFESKKINKVWYLNKEVFDYINDIDNSLDNLLNEFSKLSTISVDDNIKNLSKKHLSNIFLNFLKLYKPIYDEIKEDLKELKNSNDFQMNRQFTFAINELINYRFSYEYCLNHFIEKGLIDFDDILITVYKNSPNPRMIDINKLNRLELSI